MIIGKATFPPIPANIKMGRAIEATIEASETYPNETNTAPHIPNTISKVMGASPKNTPAEVATPLPPLNFTHILQLCPKILIIPPIIFNIGTDTIFSVNKVAIYPAKNTARNPLPASRIKARNPHLASSTLARLVAPILPLPTLLKSIPLDLPNQKLKGREPRM